MQARRERKRQQREAEEDDLIRCVFDGLAYSDGVTGAARETLSRARKISQERRQRLHAAWDAQVYQKVNDRIQQAVDARSVEDIEARLQRNAKVRTRLAARSPHCGER